MKIILRLLFFPFLPFITVAQHTDIYPIPFLQFQNNTAFYNPAANTNDAVVDLNFLNTNYTGLLKNVGLYYLDVSFKKKAATSTQTFGLIIHSEYETELLKRSRAYVRYAWKTALNKKINFSGGAAFGLYNYLVKGTVSSVGASVLALDGNAGVWLEGYHIKTGVSVNQLTNSSVNPINRAIVLKRYLTVITEYALPITDENEVLFALKINNNRINQSNIQGSVVTTLFNNYSLGVIYLHEQGAGFTLGLKNFKLTNTVGEISFSYLRNSLFSNLPTRTMNTDRIEFLLGFYIDSITQKELSD